MEPKDFLKDGGYKSRKFWLCIITMAVILLVPAITPAVALETVIMGIVTVFTVYLGGNTVNRWSSGKIAAQVVDLKEPLKVTEKPKEPSKEEEGC